MPFCRTRPVLVGAGLLIGSMLVGACDEGEVDTLEITDGPHTMTCGAGSSTYTVKVTMDAAVAYNRTIYFLHIDEDDGWWGGGDDILKDPIPSVIVPANLTVTTATFALNCTLQSCLLEGDDGHSDPETPYQIHAEQDGSGFWSDVTSANYDITCEAPEGGTGVGPG